MAPVRACLLATATAAGGAIHGAATSSMTLRGVTVEAARSNSGGAIATEGSIYCTGGNFTGNSGECRRRWPVRVPVLSRALVCCHALWRGS
jgi:hypothetical protein